MNANFDREKWNVYQSMITITITIKIMSMMTIEN